MNFTQADISGVADYIFSASEHGGYVQIASPIQYPNSDKFVSAYLQLDETNDRIIISDGGDVEEWTKANSADYQEPRNEVCDGVFKLERGEYTLYCTDPNRLRKEVLLFVTAIISHITEIRANTV